MGSNVDEDLIEATIRRVAEAKAAAEAQGSAAPNEEGIETAPEDVAPAGDTPEAPDSDSTGPDADIEATMARVAAATAAREQLGDEDTTAVTEQPIDDIGETTGGPATVDDDAIAATIARVAAAKAARHEDGAEEPTEAGPLTTGNSQQATDGPSTAGDDAIAATIARVAAAKAAAAGHESEPGRAGEAGQKAAGGTTLRDAMATRSRAEGGSGPTAGAAIDEDSIAATIRRVAEANARRGASDTGSAETDIQDAAVADAGASDASVRTSTDDVPIQDVARDEVTSPATADESAIEATIRRVAEARAAREHETVETAPARALTHEIADIAAARIPATRVEVDAAAGGDEWREATDRIEREIATINRAIAVLTQRIDGLVGEIERTTTGSAPSAHGRTANVAEDEDEWDEPPVISRLPSSLPQRPAIFRDVSQPTARAEAALAPLPNPADEVEDDEEEAPEPLRPAPALEQKTDAKSNFELLPRTYRITVEDKRRSVDLVPLHRSLRAMDGVRDMSLLSYNNGIAIVSLESVRELDPKVLEQSVSHAMSRGARVEVHNEYTMVVKLAEE